MSNFSIFGLRPPLRLLAPLITLAAASFIYLQEPLVLQVLRNAVFDQFQRWHPRQFKDHGVRIIDIDDRSLAELGQWPWPRTKVAELVQRLHDAGAASIGFDVMFSEADRTSPRAMLRSWKLTSAAAGVLAMLPDHDQVFAQALRGNHVVLGFAAIHAARQTDASLPPPAFGTVFRGPAPDTLPTFQSAILPLPALVSAAAGVGAMTFVPDADGVVRRVPLMLRIGDALLPTLAAESLRVARNEHNFLIQSDAHGAVERFAIGSLVIPTTPSGEVWVHFTRPQAQRSISA
ncbi:MAG: CHASE2 domain-containing protein, partial [Janthinobacterium lividum]